MLKLEYFIVYFWYIWLRSNISNIDMVYRILNWIKWYYEVMWNLFCRK